MGVFADYDNHSCDRVGKYYYDDHIILWGDAGSDVQTVVWNFTCYTLFGRFSS